MRQTGKHRYIFVIDGCGLLVVYDKMSSVDDGEDTLVSFYEYNPPLDTNN